MDITDEASKEGLWIHDETDKDKAFILAGYPDRTDAHFPRPFGVFYREERSCIDEEIQKQLDATKAKKGRTPLNKILSGDKTWTIV